MNMVDGVDFNKNDPCIWVLYLPGAVGDLIASIINVHYINVGCKYYGIDDNGQVIFLPADNKIPTRDTRVNNKDYNDEFFYSVADELSSKNLNYSLLDNILFTDHIFKDNDVSKIINTFTDAKIIRIHHKTNDEYKLIKRMSLIKNSPNISHEEIEKRISNDIIQPTNKIHHERLLNIDFSDIFDKEKFENMYSNIINFLNLNHKLVRYDFIEFYISKQHQIIQKEIHKITHDTQ